jgi:RNA polymerase sigma-54 factor
MNARMQMRQAQTLGLNQQQQQSLRLLQMSGVELEKTLVEEADRNPFLTVDRNDAGKRVHLRERPARAAAVATGDWLEGIAAPQVSLVSHLTGQADLQIHGADRAIAYAIISFIDDAGYLAEPVDQLADRLGIDTAEVERVLGQVQHFEPTGVAARSLSECLLLQAVEADEDCDAMRALLANLPLLAEGKLSRLERLCGTVAAELGMLVRRLRQFDPKPGMQFAPGEHGWLNPDILVRESETGWRIDLASGALPTVTLDRGARAVTAKCLDADDKNWLRDCANDARALVKAIEHRQRTLLLVATAILKHQDAFLAEGVAALRPLTMREIADELGIHESTVSRAVANKSLLCPRGTFELRFFFASGVLQESGEAASAAAIKSAIKALITGEAPNAVLSDDALVGLLRGQGYELARRTVAKYREAIGIGNSSERRRAGLLRQATLKAA